MSNVGTVVGAIVGSLVCLSLVIGLYVIFVKRKSGLCGKLRCVENDSNDDENKEVEPAKSNEESVNNFEKVQKTIDTPKTENDDRYFKFPLTKSKTNKPNLKMENTPPCIELSEEDEMYKGCPQVEYDNTGYVSENNVYEDVDEENEIKTKKAKQRKEKKSRKKKDKNIKSDIAQQEVVDDYYVTNINTAGVPKLPARPKDKVPEKDTMSDHFYLDVEEDHGNRPQDSNAGEMEYSYASEEYDKRPKTSPSSDDDLYCDYNEK